LDVVTAFLNPEVDDDDIHKVLPEGQLEGLDAHPPPIIVRLKQLSVTSNTHHGFGILISTPFSSS
jgi:hypothetical protein